MNHRHPFALITLFLAFPLAAPQMAPVSGADSAGGDFVLHGHVSGGGGHSSGGEFNLTGAIAETPAGVSTGDGFALVGGFFPQLTLPLPPGDIFLHITITPAALQISWPPEAAPYTLESTTTLGPDAAWQPVPGALGQTSILLRPDAHTRFFRMRAP